MSDLVRKPKSPRGVGLYIRAMPAREVGRRAKRMADHGVTWAAVGAVWQDKDRTIRMNDADRCRRIIEALLRQGIEPHLWGYPWVGREQEFADLMAESSTEDVVGWLLDPEKGLKKDRLDEDYDTMDEVFAAAKLLFWRCVEANPYRVIGFTSYGQVKGHPTFPWAAFAESGGFNPLEEADYGSPQLYDQPADMISKGLREYREIGFDVIIPSYGTYRFGRDSEMRRTYPRMTYNQLDHHLKRLLAHQKAYNIKAMIGWSEAQVRPDAWRAIAECAERLQLVA